VGAVGDRDEDVRPGDVFVALRGAKVDMHERLAGLGHAAALVVERDVPVPPGPTVVRVADTRRALPHLCAARLGDPGKAFPVVAVTGTNGKTSTTFLLAAIARAAGVKPGVVGTTGHWIGDEPVDATHTSPTAPVLQGLLARMRDAGCGLVAIEASSIGIATHRCDAIPFRAAVFTNLTRDHLDFHGTMDAYGAAKARLFHELLDGIAILNADDPSSARMEPPDGRFWTFALQREADLYAKVTRATFEGTEAEIDSPAGPGRMSLQLVGRHNVANALGALGAALGIGIDYRAALAGLAACRGVPGRLERVPNTRGIGVFVDYAHSDDALARVLAELRALAPGRVLTVFGCGGDRDRGKRPLMGAAAAASSDVVYVTSDNPRGEDPDAIIAQILPGVGDRPHVVEPDRARAIARALAEARPGDLVLIAGKGHETYQEIGGTKHPFDDRVVAREALA
ncbi:MAG: UDP-N-acetylmuramoyl-L-alanyl-D-glutamate--2,6-diaminopimelate ligase, partial [Myxococcota bacterium]